MASNSSEFDALVRAHGAAVSRVAAAFEREPAVREELTQDIWLAVWQALPKWRGDAPVKHFVLRIAHNRAASHALRESRAPVTGGLDDAAHTVEDAAPSVEAQAESAEQGALLMSGLRLLSVADRQVLTLALEGLSHGEIGALLDAKANAVGVRVNRARARLRKHMEALQ